MSDPSEVQVGDHTYQLTQLDARAQFHVSRRVVPLVSALANGDDKEAEGNLISRMASAISALSDEDCDYVIDHCLKGCKRKIDGDRGWAAVMRDGNLMFQDMSMADMIRLTTLTLQDNLADFFTALRLPDSEAKK
jgi:hypothetical protein